MRRVVYSGIQRYILTTDLESDPRIKRLVFSSETQTRFLLNEFFDSTTDIDAMRSCLADANSLVNLSNLTNHEVGRQLTLELLSGKIRVYTAPLGPPPARTGMATPNIVEEVVAAVETQTEEDDAVVVEFVLESDYGHILPNHPYKILDQDDNEIASGETDANGEAVIEVPDEGDYFITVDNEETFTVDGTVYERDGTTVLSDVNLMLVPWQEEEFSARTGADGELNVSEIPEGELEISYDGSSFFIYVDSDISGGSFFIPFDSQSDDEVDEPDDVDMDDQTESSEDDTPEIDPEQY